MQIIMDNKALSNDPLHSPKEAILSLRSDYSNIDNGWLLIITMLNISVTGTYSGKNKYQYSSNACVHTIP